MSKYDLSGYIAAGNPIMRRSGGKDYLIQKFQGAHSEEYAVTELQNNVPNGTAQLFENGILKMSWKVINGCVDGFVTVYENGVVKRMTMWDNLDRNPQRRETDRIREVINDESGKRRLVERVVGSGVIIYKGDYNRTNFEKEGWGIEYDERSGIREGYDGRWRKASDD